MSDMPEPGTERKPAAFTLVELLVVIGIIALLISILLPALNRARAAAQSTTCMSNMRQIGMAMAMYVSDNHGFIPPACAKAYASYDATFDLLLDQYLNAMDPALPDPYVGVSAQLDRPARIWRCPSDGIDRDLTAHYGTARSPAQPRSYVMNLWVSAFQQAPYFYGQSVKLTKIKGAMNQVVLMGELWTPYTALRCNVDSATMFQRPPHIMSPTAVYGTHPNEALNLLMNDFSVQNISRKDFDERLGGAPYPEFPYMMYAPWN